jgi:hypothetical protein
VLCILSICLLILHLSVAICEICLLYFTYGVCLVLSLKPGVTGRRDSGPLGQNSARGVFLLFLFQSYFKLDSKTFEIIFQI